MTVEMFFCRQRMGRTADNYSSPCSFTQVGWSGAGVDTSDTPPKSADGRGIAVERLAGLWDMWDLWVCGFVCGLVCG